MAEPIRVEEAYSERDETINAQGAVTEIEIPYLVFGVADESAALATAANMKDPTSFRSVISQPAP